jgi:hypothetical protein
MAPKSLHGPTVRQQGDISEWIIWRTDHEFARMDFGSSLPQHSHKVEIWKRRPMTFNE